MANLELKTGYNFGFISRMAHPEKVSTICLEGGGRSGKTRDVINLLFLIALNADKLLYIDAHTGQKRRVKTILVAGELWAWLKIRAYADFQNHLKESNIYARNAHHKSDHTYTINEVTFLFMGADDPQKFKGVESDIAWINEPVPGFPAESYEFIKQRCGWFNILDWNPVLPDAGAGAETRHWCYKLADQKGVYFVKSTILNNPFAPAGARQTILGYEPTPENILNGTANPRLWRVFGLGERASYEGLVYPDNFFTLDTAPDSIKLEGYGGDFGYTNDPTALVAVYRMRVNPSGTKRPALFCRTLIYDTGLLNSHIVGRLKTNKVPPHVLQVWDSEAPKDVADIAAAGYAAIGAKKGPGSVISGINTVKEYDIYTLKGDALAHESLLYSRKLMPGTENVYLAEPVKKFGHAMDALRYFISDILRHYK
jgi:phage terminase large subunit